MFSVDYPFAANDSGRQFLDNLHLSDNDMEKLCWRNAAEFTEASNRGIIQVYQPGLWRLSRLKNGNLNHNFRHCRKLW
jgi:hypothetical protein